MKKNIFILMSLLFVFSCNSAKQKVTNNPFTITEATYQRWFGGVEGARGVKITLKTSKYPQEATYKTIYYLNKKAKAYSKLNDGVMTIAATINTSVSRNTHLSLNRSDEFKNNTAVEKPKYPNLTKNEAVVEYEQNGVLKHYKFNVVEKKTLYYE